MPDPPFASAPLACSEQEAECGKRRAAHCKQGCTGPAGFGELVGGRFRGVLLLVDHRDGAGLDAAVVFVGGIVAGNGNLLDVVGVIHGIAVSVHAGQRKIAEGVEPVVVGGEGGGIVECAAQFSLF